MKTETPFEIKVALLGNVSAGKSTVLNALLRDKYSEVAMNRTTAGVNYFRLYKNTPERTEEQNCSKDATEVPGEDSSDSKGATKVDHWDNPAENPHTAESTLREITEDNRTKLSADSPTVPEKFFDVQVDHDLVEMRPDTRLVLVDVPGLNEAGAGFDQYKAYVRDHWRNFDCVVLVMDGKLGVNTQDQVFLLHFVSDLLETKKKMPVIVLCNKVDDPDDEEQALLVNEARAEVENIFRASDRAEALRDMLKKIRNSRDLVLQSHGFSPAFIPVSAINGYIQLSASRMSLEQFAGFDRDLVEKLGREQIGRRRWIKLSEEEKIKEVYELVNDPESCKEVINESNFTSFLDTLVLFVGGERTQLELLKNRVYASVKLLKSEPFHVGTFSCRLQSLWREWMQLFDEQPKHSREEFGQTFLLAQPSMLFWERYSKWESLAFEEFESSWKGSKPQPSPLSHPMKELLSYYEFIRSSEIDLSMEKQTICFRMKRLVSRFLDIVLRENIRSENPKDPDLNKLTPYDLALIFESVLLVAFDHSFCEEFGSQIVQLRAQMPDGREWISNNFAGDSASLCPACGCKMGEPCVNVMYCPKVRCNQQIHFRTVGQDGQVVEPQVKIPKKCTLVKKFLSEWLEMTTDAASGVCLPKHPTMYSKLVKVNVPSSLSNPEHFGHISWLYCRAKSAIMLGEEKGTGLKQFLTSLEGDRDQGLISPVTPPKLNQTSFTAPRSITVTLAPRDVLSDSGTIQEKPCDVLEKTKRGLPSRPTASLAPAGVGISTKQAEAAAEAAPNDLAGWGDTFAQKEGSWKCDACMVQNEKDSVQCAACEKPRPGQKPADDDKKESDSKPAISSSIGPGGFSFGGAPGAGFGFDSASKATAMASTNVFAFGSGTGGKAASFSFDGEQKGGFSFGSGDVSFGTKEDESKIPERNTAVSTSSSQKSQKGPVVNSKSSLTFPPMLTKAPAMFGSSTESSEVTQQSKSSSTFPPMSTKAPAVFGTSTKSSEVAQKSKSSSTFPPMPTKAPAVFGNSTKSSEAKQKPKASSQFPRMPDEFPSVFGSPAQQMGKTSSTFPSISEKSPSLIATSTKSMEESARSGLLSNLLPSSNTSQAVFGFPNQPAVVQRETGPSSFPPVSSKGPSVFGASAKPLGAAPTPKSTTSSISGGATGTDSAAPLLFKSSTSAAFPPLSNNVPSVFGAKVTDEGVQFTATQFPPDPDYFTILTEFYKNHDPRKVQGVRSLLEKYKGREKELCFKLGQKYKVANPLDAVPTDADSKSTPSKSAGSGIGGGFSSLVQTPFSTASGQGFGSASGVGVGSQGFGALAHAPAPVGFGSFGSPTSAPATSPFGAPRR